jgi:hypothetical protein
MFAKDAPFHFILASHLQPVNQVDDPIILNKIRYKMNLGAVAWLVFFWYCRFETRQMRFGIRWCLVCFEAVRPGMDRLNLACRKCRWRKTFVLWKVVLEFNAGIVMEHISKEALP